MALTTFDLIDPQFLKKLTDWLAGEEAILTPAAGDGSETLFGALDDTGVTATLPAAGSAIGIASIPPELPEQGSFLILPSIATVVCLGVTSTGPDTVTVAGVVFSAVTSPTPGADQFDRSGTDTETAQSLAAAIQLHFAATGDIGATAALNVVTVFVGEGIDRVPYAISSSDSTRLSVSPSTFGGSRERVRYTAIDHLISPIVTVLERGDDNTLATAHPNGAPIIWPSSMARRARRAFEEVVGDSRMMLTGGSPSWAVLDPPGVGYLGWSVLEALGGVFRNQIESAKASNLLLFLVSACFQAIDGHIGQIAPSVLLGTPSTGPLVVSDLSHYLVYQNDPTTGRPYSCLVLDRTAFLYWNSNPQVVLDPRGVIAPYTRLAHGGVGMGGLVGSALDDSINRYGDPSGTAWVQGFAGARIRARVATPGTGTLTLSCLCQGMDASMRYYGRPATCQIDVGSDVATTDAPAIGDHITLNGVAFTARSVITLPEVEFFRDATNILTATNLADVINAYSTAHWNSRIQATSDPADHVITLSEIDNDPTTQAILTDNYIVLSSSVTTLALFPGSPAISSATVAASFGGGSLDGTQADSDQVGVDVHQELPRTFTFIAGALDMTAAGHSLELVNNGIGALDDPMDRVLQIIRVTGTSTGAGGSFVIESIPDRLVP